MTKLIDAVTTAQKETKEKLQMNEEIITRLQDLIDVCYDGKKLTWTDMNEVADLIIKVKAQKGTI